MSDRFVGTWLLVSFLARDADGRETSTYGPSPRVSLIYDNCGRMWVQIARSDQRPFNTDDPLNVRPEEPREAFDGYFGYFGRYTVDERAGTVTHHVEACSYPNFVGTDQLRLFTFEIDRLVLTTLPEPMGGSAVTYVATWNRMR